MMQQFKLLSNILLASQNCQGVDIALHDLRMGLDLMSIHLPEPTIATFTLKPVIYLRDVIKKGTPYVKKVTSIHTICEAMNSNNDFKEMLPTIHQLLRLYMTVPITSDTSEKTFSALQRLQHYIKKKKKFQNTSSFHYVNPQIPLQ